MKEMVDTPRAGSDIAQGRRSIYQDGEACTMSIGAGFSAHCGEEHLGYQEGGSAQHAFKNHDHLRCGPQGDLSLEALLERH